MRVKLIRERLTSMGWRNQGWTGELPTPEAVQFIDQGFASACDPLPSDTNPGDDPGRQVGVISRRRVTADMKAGLQR